MGKISATKYNTKYAFSKHYIVDSQGAISEFICAWNCTRKVPHQQRVEQNISHVCLHAVGA